MQLGRTLLIQVDLTPAILAREANTVQKLVSLLVLPAPTAKSLLAMDYQCVPVVVLGNIVKVL